MKRPLSILLLIAGSLAWLVAQSTIKGPVPQPGAVAVAQGPNFVLGRAVRINFSGQLDTVNGNLGDCVHVDGGAAPCAAGVGGGSGPVTSVFGRTGAVTRVLGDYSFFDLNGVLLYNQLTGSGAQEGDGMCFHAGQWGPGNCNGGGGGGGAVSGVFGRTGNVIAASGDYQFTQIGGTLPPSLIAQNGANPGEPLVWNGNQYAPAPYAGPSFADAETPAGSVNGINLQFTLEHAPNPPESLLLWRNGLVMAAGEDYFLSAATISFFMESVPETGGKLKASYRF